MASERDETRQRWTAKRRAALVLSLLKGETSAAAAVPKPTKRPRRRRRTG